MRWIVLGFGWVLGACHGAEPAVAPAGAASSVPSVAAAPATSPSPVASASASSGVRFAYTVGFEQFGRPLVITHHEVHACADVPFTIVITTHRKLEVEMYASFEPTAFDAARRGESLKRFFADGYGMAEGVAPNLESTLYVHHADPGFHYWDDERFHDLRRGAEVTVARRWVETLDDVEMGFAVSFADAKVLYLVFAQGAQSFKLRFDGSCIDPAAVKGD